MKLGEALPAFKDLELRMAEVYLWCSANFEGEELRKFFLEMSDQERSHARALDSLSAKLAAAKLWLEIPDGLPNQIGKEIQETAKALKNDPDLENAFARLADMELGELNSVFESIMRAAPEPGKADFLELTTKRHIQFLKDGCARFLPGSKVLSRLAEILVKDRNYYRVFSG